MKSSLVIATLILSSFLFGQEIKWLSLEEASKEIKAHPEKPVLINFYTTWCGFCKRLDKETFANAQVSEYVKNNYIAVKFDAETKDMVKFMGIQYTYIAPAKANYLAYALTNGQLSYPATVLMNGKGDINKIVLGYRSSSDFITDIKI
ncbi:thioredoxin family protein [Empedobacter stercoris]|uniref:thioredoxin family protein n=1 Tax=Empedobacter stercoris TaxID=1628248 RepID=UPI0021B02D78|nr:thioredoxin family protein [Empedobacter stercoris]UWX65954.1 thioredoxin family protein [Empedobacter stercoris]